MGLILDQFKVQYAKKFNHSWPKEYLIAHVVYLVAKRDVEKGKCMFILRISVA